MDDNFLLFYLIEGTPEISYVSVSHNSNGKPVEVEDLRKTIFQDRCKLFVENHQCLTLSKIYVDPAQQGNYLPLLRFNKGDEGVEELSPWSTISEIWPEPTPEPVALRIHIFVTFTKFLEGVKGTRGILEAAYRVYYKFWWELEGGLDTLLQPVSGHKVKHLPKEHVDSLQLRRLSYNEPILLIREEYERAYEYLQEQEGLGQRLRSGGIVISGQPGIGKSCFLYYLLFRLLSLKKSVAFQMDGQFLLFQDSGVEISNNDANNGTLLPDGIWTLSDSHPGFDQPCDAFLKAGKSCGAWIIQTTSPLETRWRSWSNAHSAEMYWMDVVTLDEVIALGELLYLDTKIIHDCYDTWGPSARNCIKFAKRPQSIRSHAVDVFNAAIELTRNASDFTGFTEALATHRIFVVRPSDESREIPSMDFGTDNLREIVARAYTKQENAARYNFYKTIRAHPWFGAPAGHMYEAHVLLWLCYARATATLSCTGAGSDSPKLDIPSCPGNVVFIESVDALKNLIEPEGPLCLIPTSRTFPTVDAVILTADAVITLQITIASKHDASEKGFRILFNNLPKDLLTKRPRRCHVFITDEESNAKSLRAQKLKAIPTGTRIYSTVVGVNTLDLQAPATMERMEALRKAKVTEQTRREVLEKVKELPKLSWTRLIRGLEKMPPWRRHLPE